jgi:hypothetical protein
VDFEAVLSEHFSFAGTMALTALTVFVLAAVVVAVGRERRGLEFGVAVPEAKA